MRLLHIPLSTYKNVLTILKLENYSKVIATLKYQDRKKVAVDIVQVSYLFSFWRHPSLSFREHFYYLGEIPGSITRDLT